MVTHCTENVLNLIFALVARVWAFGIIQVAGGKWGALYVASGKWGMEGGYSGRMLRCVKLPLLSLNACPMARAFGARRAGRCGHRQRLRTAPSRCVLC